MAGQNKASTRKKLRSAFAHKRLADYILSAITSQQTSWNATMDKLDADTDIALDTDYVSTAPAVDSFESDDEGSSAQHKVSLRKTLRSALAHKKAADEICDAMEEMGVAYGVMLAKLDAQAGTLVDTDWVDSAGVSALDLDSVIYGAQYKRSLREIVRSAMANREAADSMLEAILAIQENMNASLAELDAGNVNGAHAGFKVSELDPDAE